MWINSLLQCSLAQFPSLSDSSAIWAQSIIVTAAIIATLSLILSVLKERLDKLGRGDEDWQSFLALTTTLISTGIKSAVKTLQILSDEDSLLG